MNPAGADLRQIEAQIKFSDAMDRFRHYADTRPLKERAHLYAYMNSISEAFGEYVSATDPSIDIVPTQVIPTD